MCRPKFGLGETDAESVDKALDLLQQLDHWPEGLDDGMAVVAVVVAG